MKNKALQNLLALTAVAILLFPALEGSTPLFCRGIVPLNNLSVEMDSATGISEPEWNDLFAKYQKIYAPIIEARGGHLVLNLLWFSGKVNSFAARQGNDWVLNIYGGMGRYPGMTKDSMWMVVCHETGHHLGGAPKVGGDATTGAKADQWETDEGEADYYAGLKCLRNIFADEDNVKIVAGMSLDPTIVENCKAQFSNPNERAICERSGQAGLVLAQVLSDIMKETSLPSIATPSTYVSTTTYDFHSESQCRLDTFFQGTLCGMDRSVDLSDADYHPGSCTAPQFSVGLRPVCWFKPAE